MRAHDKAWVVTVLMGLGQHPLGEAQRSRRPALQSARFPEGHPDLLGLEPADFIQQRIPGHPRGLHKDHGRIAPPKKALFGGDDGPLE